MDGHEDPTRSFSRYQYNLFLQEALNSSHITQYCQMPQEYRYEEIYQTPLSGRIYNRFVFLPKKANWCSVHRCVVKNILLNWQCDWPFHASPCRRVHANQKLSCCELLPAVR